MLMKNNEKLNFLENEQMKNPTLTCIIHAYELLDNDFKTWALLKTMYIYIYIYIYIFIYTYIYIYIFLDSTKLKTENCLGKNNNIF